MIIPFTFGKDDNVPQSKMVVLISVGLTIKV